MKNINVVNTLIESAKIVFGRKFFQSLLSSAIINAILIGTFFGFGYILFMLAWSSRLEETAILAAYLLSILYWLLLTIVFSLHGLFSVNQFKNLGFIFKVVFKKFHWHLLVSLIAAIIPAILISIIFFSSTFFRRFDYSWRTRELIAYIFLITSILVLALSWGYIWFFMIIKSTFRIPFGLVIKESSKLWLRNLHRVFAILVFFLIVGSAWSLLFDNLLRNAWDIALYLIIFLFGYAKLFSWFACSSALLVNNVLKNELFNEKLRYSMHEPNLIVSKPKKFATPVLAGDALFESELEDYDYDEPYRFAKPEFKKQGMQEYEPTVFQDESTSLTDEKNPDFKHNDENESKIEEDNR